MQENETTICSSILYRHYVTNAKSIYAGGIKFLVWVSHCRVQDVVLDIGCGLNAESRISSKAMNRKVSPVVVSALALSLQAI